jgi:hypothetical protein
MGTRGIVGFVVDGQEKLSYNHFDSYPDYLGVHTLEWLKSKLTTRDGLAYLQADTEEAIRSLQMVDESGVPTPEQFERVKRFYNGSVGSRTTDDGQVDDSLNWYQALREAQGDLGRTLDGGFALDSKGFALDSLFCEWGYIIDLDAERFDVYRGFQQEVPTEGRWAGVANTEDEERPGIPTYHPIQRIMSIPFADVAGTDPETFVAQAEQAAGHGEDDD